ncbi:MAG: hypothetical protein QG635_1648, partial [Bacteroidota bacterium]|nr:hypothetical protein [Bacteroidota bacterium]
ERRINSGAYYYIPSAQISKIESKLSTGDIIAIATSKKGLDYSHTGLAYRDNNGLLRFLHASSKKKSVTLDMSLNEYISSVSLDTGITVLRAKDNSM